MSHTVTPTIWGSWAVCGVKYTFLFLANFVQARLLPAQAEKAPRACTQCRKSASRADLTSFGKCSAQGAQCNASRVRCTAHPVLWTASCAPCSTASGKCQMARAARIARGARWSTSRAVCVTLPASRTMADVACRASSGDRIARTGERQVSRAWCFSLPARCTMDPAFRLRQPASRLLLDAVARGG